MSRALIAALLILAATRLAAQPEIGLAFARGTESGETDIVRLMYRQPLKDHGAWWMPAQLQLGADIWRVPDIRGTTRRFDLSLTPIWRGERPWGYFEAGFGGYVLSKTINNAENRLPSSFQFGSHIGAGLRVGKNARLGIALQHLSNAGIKQPNGGIDLVLVQYTVSTGTPNR